MIETPAMTAARPWGTKSAARRAEVTRQVLPAFRPTNEPNPRNPDPPGSETPWWYNRGCPLPREVVMSSPVTPAEPKRPSAFARLFPFVVIGLAALVLASVWLFTGT